MRKIFILFLVFSVLIIPSVFAENETINRSESVNLTVSPEEAMMNLAFEARAYALNAGEEKAIAEFNNPGGLFAGNSTHLVAYKRDGTLLADFEHPEKIGEKEIKDDHDSGLIRQMRDYALSGGGIFSDPANPTIRYFVTDIDGTWWIAVSETK